MIDRKHCAGCRNDYYNDGAGLNGTCWSRKDAKLVKRLKVHINDVPPWKHPAKDYPDCYRAAQFVMVDPEARR